MTAEALFTNIIPLIIAAGIFWIARSVQSLSQHVSELTIEVRFIKEKLVVIEHGHDEINKRVDKITEAHIANHGVFK